MVALFPSTFTQECSLWYFRSSGFILASFICSYWQNSVKSAHNSPRKFLLSSQKSLRRQELPRPEERGPVFRARHVRQRKDAADAAKLLYRRRVGLLGNAPGPAILV